MTKIRFKPPLRVIAPIPIYITEIDFDQSNKDLFITFPVYDPDTSIKQKNAAAIQQLIHELNSRTTAKPQDNCLYCRIPETSLVDVQTWLYKKTTKDKHASITQIFAEALEEAKPDQSNIQSPNKPPKGKLTTEFVIGAFNHQNKSKDLHQTANARKIANQNEYVFKLELLAELEAFHGELSRLLFSPSYAPKVRSVHKEDGKPEGVASKRVKEFCSLIDLLIIHGKVLTAQELKKVGIARYLVFSLAMEETDPNCKNCGIDRPLSADNKITEGTCLTRLDPGLATFSLINFAYKIYGLPNYYDTHESRAFPRKVAPENAFPIHADDFLSLPNLHHATPSNWPFHANRKLGKQTQNFQEQEAAATQNVDLLGDDEEFNIEKCQHLLKVMLISDEMLENIGKAFLSDSKILNTVHDEKFRENLTPAYVDTSEFQINAKKFGDEYRKAILKALYVNHYIKRFAQWRDTLINIPEFREYLLNYDEQYLHAINREFQEYNNQFVATKKTSNSDIHVIERTEGIKIGIPYKKKYLHRLVDLDSVSKECSRIHSEAQVKQEAYYNEFLDNLEKYLRIHKWEVGMQWSKKVILDEKGVEKAVPTCVYSQMEEIKKYRSKNQSLKETVDNIMRHGTEAYDKIASSKSSQDSQTYYGLFKNKKIRKVFEAVKPIPLDETFVPIL